ncbi:class I SAM-dependent methyltransferase [Paraliomyxa miuraensis]|uniref:hypothetical protein n=1 Tax=Paraliomyxa miuraensis TaxID=376150 RepID=UPI00225B148E|nr:hypothetical protein [Paraliomyxa miuraensis]MCX4243889.1 hypothetical protein [Paraliomyxa miuraensis]
MSTTRPYPPSNEDPTDHHPRALLRRLYRDEFGYDLSPAEDARVAATLASSTYGELMPAATDHLVEQLGLGPGDVFYDLGSGLGKVVLQVALRAPVRRCIGIELVRSRHRVAQRILGKVRAQAQLRAAECGFRLGDMMRARISDATVVYTCSTAFSTKFMNLLAERLARLPPGLRWVSTQDIDDNPWFRLERVLRLDMSWRRRSKVHVYRLANPALRCRRRAT